MCAMQVPVSQWYSGIQRNWAIHIPVHRCRCELCDWELAYSGARSDVAMFFGVSRVVSVGPRAWAGQVNFGCETPAGCVGLPSSFSFRVLSLALFSVELPEPALSVLAGSCCPLAAVRPPASVLQQERCCRAGVCRTRNHTVALTWIRFCRFGHRG
jgi:hypothetical protein